MRKTLLSLRQTVNRQPASSPETAKTPAGRAARRPQPAARPTVAAPARRFSPVQSLQEIKSELKKVTWPSAEDTRRLTIVVLIVATTVGIALGLVDFFFSWLVNSVLIGR